MSVSHRIDHKHLHSSKYVETTFASIGLQKHDQSGDDDKDFRTKKSGSYATPNPKH